MNLKKIALTLACLLFLGSFASAEIALKDIGGGKVEITFTFKDPSPEMGVIGSFNNWTVPGEPMTKNAAGVWEKTIQALATDELVYKFYSKGSWLQDEMAPDKKDDGYGGKNGLIIVADILSGATPMVPGAPAAAAPAAAGAKKPAGRPKVTFGTETYLDSTTVFNTSDNTFTESDLNAKSLWKFNGDLIPNVPGHLEITAVKGQNKIVTKPDTGNAGEGLKTLSTGFLFSPLYYLSGNTRPSIDKFAFGIDSPYLVWETGYANSVVPKHTAVLWDTVSDANTAGDGYSLFRLGPDARNLGDFTVDGAVVPNKSIDGYYGYYAWLSGEAYGIRTELQYDLKSSTKTDTTAIFKDPLRQDYILGAEAYVDEFQLKGQVLLSRFIAGGATDSLAASKRMAYKVVGGYKDVYDSLQALFGYAYRGSVAQMLYAKNDDVLGTAMTQTLSFNGYAKAGYWGVFKLDSTVVMPTSESADTNTAVTATPGVTLNFAALQLAKLTLDTYVKVGYNTAPAAGVDTFAVKAVGSKLTADEATVWAKVDNGTKDALFTSVLAESTVVKGLVLQAGAGYRTGSLTKNAYAGLLGVRSVLDVPQAKSPTVYAQFLYNMDPFNAVGASTYDLTDFGPTSGPKAYDGLGNLRAGISWNY